MGDLPDILAEIIEHKRGEVERARAAVPVSELRHRVADAPPLGDMVAALRREPGDPIRILGEIKRKSPSAGLIRPDFHPVELAGQLSAGGADAISVLTDEKHFGGSLQILADVRDAVGLPVLRKDFIIDSYQVEEARAFGADAFLLIADALEASLLADLVALGGDLGMAALVESHDEPAMEKALASGAVLIGVNNRNLHTFEVSLETTVRLGSLVGDDRVLVSESGITRPDDISMLLAAGADAVLVGESLMRAESIAEAIRDFKGAR